MLHTCIIFRKKCFVTVTPFSAILQSKINAHDGLLQNNTREHADNKNALWLHLAKCGV